MTVKTTNRQPSSHLVASLTRKLHALIASGEGEGDDAEKIRDEMEAAWWSLTSEERARLTGLSEDLYTLAEGPKVVVLSSDEKERWSAESRAAFLAMSQGPDITLAFLRRPLPAGLPWEAALFLQARCWERLGDLGTAVVFMEKAVALDPSNTLHLMILLQQAGRLEEADKYAWLILGNPRSTPLEVYLSGGVVIDRSRQLPDDEAKPQVAKLIPILERALRLEVNLPPADREMERTGAGIAAMLGLCYERLGQMAQALATSKRALVSYPRDGELLTVRGLALLPTQPDVAMGDFEAAVRAGAASGAPYYHLAYRAMQQGRYFEAWPLCRQGLGKRDNPRQADALFHEWMGISMFVLGQPLDWILQEFDEALKLDPGSKDRIAHNRGIVLANADQPRSQVPKQGWGMKTQPESWWTRELVQSSTVPSQEAVSARRQGKLGAVLAST